MIVFLRVTCLARLIAASQASAPVTVSRTFALPRSLPGSTVYLLQEIDSSFCWNSRRARFDPSETERPRSHTGCYARDSVHIFHRPSRCINSRPHPLSSRLGRVDSDREGLTVSHRATLKRRLLCEQLLRLWTRRFYDYLWSTLITQCL